MTDALKHISQTHTSQLRGSADATVAPGARRHVNSFRAAVTFHELV